MKFRYTYNKYGVYPNKSENDVLLMEEKNNILTINVMENYKCGRLNDKTILENKENDIKNNRIRVLSQPVTSQKYFDYSYKYPLRPQDQPYNALEGWELKQPLSFPQDVSVFDRTNDNQYPVTNIDIYQKLIPRYDNPNIYRQTFFNQNDGRSRIYNYGQEYLKYRNEVIKETPYSKYP